MVFSDNRDRAPHGRAKVGNENIFHCPRPPPPPPLHPIFPLTLSSTHVRVCAQRCMRRLSTGVSNFTAMRAKGTQNIHGNYITSITYSRRLHLQRMLYDAMSRLNGHESYTSAGAASHSSSLTTGSPFSESEGHNWIHPPCYFLFPYNTAPSLHKASALKYQSRLSISTLT